MSELNLSESEKEMLAELDQKMNIDLNSDTSGKIVDYLFNKDFADMMTNISMAELKRLVVIWGKWIAFGDEVAREVVTKYILLKIAKEGKGRAGMEAMGRANIVSEMYGQPGQGWFSRFKRRITND